MQRFVLTVLAALVAVPLPAAQAGTEEPGPAGSNCGFWSVNDPGTNHFTAALYGGPLVGNGTLTCTIQVGGPTHADPDDATASAANSGVVVLNPTVVEYDTAPDQDVYLCTQWTPAGGTPLYLHGGDDVEDGHHWSSDPASTCEVAVRHSSEDGQDVFRTLVDPLLCPLIPVVLTGSVAGGLVTVDETGDVVVAGQNLYNCPPY